MEAFLAVVYVVTLGLLSIYGLHRLWLVSRFSWIDEDSSEPPPGYPLPRVAVQLPIYNERTVAERLIRAAGALDYPSDRLEIQVLDDSTDETRSIVDEHTRALAARGLRARVLRRPHRDGFKAGALDAGMRETDAELVCIFDADFAPPADFLRRLVGHFQDSGIGMVQARWGHANRDESWLTRAQSVLLDGHFVVEHKVRFDTGRFFNFNGTAGIWRRRTIDDAGGWQHDTLTEDLDLSYRAQLRGWRFVYAPSVVAPGEVPPSIAAFKSQQRRWAKGSVQVVRKLAWRLLRSEQPPRIKLEALAHLTGNTGYPLVLALAVLMPLVATSPTGVPHWLHLTVFVLCTLSVAAFYETCQRAVRRPLRKRWADILAAMSLGIGMSVSQTRAVFEGVRGGTGVFVRTPKRGETDRVPGYRARLAGIPGLELVLAAWFAWAISSALRENLWGSLPFLGLFFAGFTWVGMLSLCHWARR